MPGDDDELARTATAIASASSGPADGVGSTLGRYRLERELGAGGMGVVHAAFDPDLERRIALKVLRTQAAGTEAKDRLLREARAMARLAHPNVVTVHEVGTANGRDYVAMELIAGETLADWLRATKRPEQAIIDAFVAAGRGLAAAHTAGIVHRDFKPHNVLRSRDGRIVVTDFGLAREAQGAMPLPLETTLPLAGAVTAQTTPSSLSGITVTGSVLGTPAYMAPEQWSGGAVTPATDQFAYCVALWEALAGHRPFHGATLDELRAEVAKGPQALDHSKLPRRLRPLLARGLDPDPAKRWPSMDVLLDRIAPPEVPEPKLLRWRRRLSWKIRLGFSLVVVSGAMAYALFADTESGTAITCDPPRRELASVWSPAIANELGGKLADHDTSVIERDARMWVTAREVACRGEPKLRDARLHCLDAVLERFAAVRQGFERAAPASGEDLAGELVAPEVCTGDDLPRLTLAPTPGVIAAYEQYARSEAHAAQPAAIQALLDKPDLEPCAHVIAAIAMSDAIHDTSRQRRYFDGAMIAIEQCGDERLRADLLYESAPLDFEVPIVGARGEAAIKRAAVASRRVMQPDVDAQVTHLAELATRMRASWAEALRFADRIAADYRRRGLRHHELGALVLHDEALLLRAEPGDFEAVHAASPGRRAFAAALHDVERDQQLARGDAIARLWLGDVATAHKDLVAIWEHAEHRVPIGGGRTIEGSVVDGNGQPVAGATVASGGILVADSAGIGLPIYDADGGFRRTTTDAAGHFKIEGTSLQGAVQAELGAQRSRPQPLAEHVRLVLEPTRRLAGKVALGAQASSKLDVAVEPVDGQTLVYQLIGPVAADGSFVLDGAPIGKARICLNRHNEKFGTHYDYQPVPPGTTPITGLVVTSDTSDRAFDVIVRSSVGAPLDGAQTFILPGNFAFPKLGDLFKWQGPRMRSQFAKPVNGERDLGAVADQVKPEDLVAHYTDAPAGDLTVCAVGFQGDLLDPTRRERMQAHLADLEIHCQHVAVTATSVLLVTPPQRRYD